MDELSAAARAGAGAPGILAPEEPQQVTDGEPPVGRLGHRELGLKVVAVPPSALLLDDVPGCGKVADDPERAALSDADRRGDVAQPRIPVAGDAQQYERMIGKEAPGRHARKIPQYVSGIPLLVSASAPARLRNRPSEPGQPRERGRNPHLP